MPLYAFRCADCHLDFDVKARYEAGTPRFPFCPQCDGWKTVKRILTPAYLHGSPNMPNA